MNTSHQRALDAARKELRTSGLTHPGQTSIADQQRAVAAYIRSLVIDGDTETLVDLLTEHNHLVIWELFARVQNALRFGDHESMQKVGDYLTDMIGGLMGDEVIATLTREAA